MMQQIEALLEHVQELFNANDYDRAKELLLQERHRSDLPSSSKAYLNHLLGRICYYREELGEARRFFVESLACDANDSYSILYLARIADALGDTRTALRLYAEVYDTTPPWVHIAGHVRRLLRQAPWEDDELAEFFSKKKEVEPARSHKAPLVSIVVLCYNKAEYTLRCLEAVFRNTDYPRYEVIVLDNASTDITPALLEAYDSRIKFIHSPTNLGFVGGNNFAARSAEGDFLVFLNNDTEVQPGWLTEVYNCFLRNPRAGVVGSMLIYPNGMLQEAGGVIFNDASGWNYGRGHLPNSSRFQFVREVDYCSGAALTIKADLFRRLGGFDERFAPAYYEDTDLCFAVRKLGYKVLYCPSSKVIHHEGITSGTDLSSGFKKFQVINAPKFKEKWKKELALQYPCDERLRYQFCSRHRGKRILIIDDLPPLPDRAAGSLRMYHTVKQMLALGYQVTYVHLTGLALGDAAATHLAELRSAGVELVWLEYGRWWDIRETPSVQPLVERLIAGLELPLRKLDLVYICFWHIARYFMDLIRKADPSVPIVVDSMDVHFLRELRRAELLKDPMAKEAALRIKKQELAVYAQADGVTTVTEADRAILQKELPGKPIFIMTDVHDPRPVQNPFERRKDFLFIGNFNHNPNEDAVVFFVQKVFPLIKKQLPEAHFWIVGNNPTEKVKKLASSDVTVTGWVPETRPFLEQCRVAVVPLRYGAGNKGKVGEALAHGLPIVTTSIGAEGMNIVDGEHAFVADDPAEFAQRAIELHTNGDLWKKFSSAGQELVASQYASALMRRRIEYLTSFTTRHAFSSSRAVRFSSPPRVSIIILAHNQYTYTRQCLRSIGQFTHMPHEIIVVDNASTDGTPKKVEEEFPEVRLLQNKENLGFPAGVNQGINAAMGEHIVLLNNDTIVTEGWLERLLDVAEADPAIGIVGTVSNYISGVQRDPEAVYQTIDEMHAYASKMRKERKGEQIIFPRVAFVCTLIMRKVIEAIGGLDERFTPGNYEDDDFCLRATLAGFTTVIAKDVFIHHFGSRSFLAGGKEQYHARLQANRVVFLEKWGVDPDTLWSKCEKVNLRKRSLNVPLHRDAFIQYWQRAQLLLEEQEMALGMETLDKALAVFHTSERENTPVEYTDLLNLAGHVALALGLLEKAKQYFEEELSLTPQSAQACVGLGEVFFQAGMNHPAKTMFEHAVVNAHTNLSAKEGLAKVNRQLGLAEDHNSLLIPEVASTADDTMLVVAENNHL
jgi:GT2 family glycosyltransferase